MDKIVAKQIFRSHGLTVAKELVVERGEGASQAARRVIESLGSNVVVKPSSQGSAVGVLFGEDEAGIEAAIAAAWRFDERALVEERIVGKEITCAILERDGVEALPVIEVRTPENTWYDFEHRYTAGFSQHV